MEVLCCVARLVSSISEMSEAVKCHRSRSSELVKRSTLVKSYLERLQRPGAAPENWRGTLDLLRESLEKTRNVVEECGRGKVYRALFYAGVRDRLEEAWNGLGDALQDIGVASQLDRHMPEGNDREEDLTFGDLEIAYQRGRMDRKAFVELLFDMKKISVEELEECQLEVAELQKQIQRSSQHKQEVEDHYLDQIVAHLSILCPISESNPTLTVPPGHLCIICSHPMLDPVCTLLGHTYCRHCIEEWFKKGRQTNPVDNRDLHSSVLVDNIALRLSVESCLSEMEPFRTSPREGWSSLIARYAWEEVPGSRRHTDIEPPAASAPPLNPPARSKDRPILATPADDAEAQNSLGTRFEKGTDGTERNPAKAFKCYQKSAKRGFREAQFHLARCYENGVGTLMDAAKACKWYDRAAKQGHTLAHFHLGVCYKNGWGVPKDLVRASECYRRSAELGNAAAQNNLGACFEYGWGVARDLGEAFGWYGRAAEQGDATGEYNLGRCYENGLGVGKSLAEARRWYQKAAAQGDANALNNLAWYYESGWGGGKSPTEACVCFRLAAEQGSHVAQFNLGVCYERGFGVAKDLGEAEKWYRKAKANGSAVNSYNTRLQKKIFGSGRRGRFNFFR